MREIYRIDDIATYEAKNFRFELNERVATLTLDGPERKNPLTFASYSEMRELFRALAASRDVRAVVIAGAGGNFCSGGDVNDIIGPLLSMSADDQFAFTSMTGELVKAMRACPQPIVAAVDGVCAGAGAILALASDLRLGTHRAKVSFLFVKVGLAGCDMGACAMLPRVIGLGRAAELLYTGRSMDGTEGAAWGFFNAVVAPESLAREAAQLAAKLANGPSAAHALTKKMLHAEWAMALDDAIDAEAKAQASCMRGNDFRRAYEAFVAKRAPVFEGD